MIKKFALVFAAIAFISFSGMSAQERGFYLVADGSLGFEGQFGLSSNDRDFVQVHTSGNVQWKEPYKRNTDWKASIGTGFMFGDKGLGARYAVEIGVGFGSTKTSYDYDKSDGALISPDKIYYPSVDHRTTYDRVHFNNDNGYNNRATLLGAHASFIRRMNLGNGIILEPRITAAFDYALRAEYDEKVDYWDGNFNTKSYRVSFTPFVLEYRFEQNRNFGVKFELGDISYSYCDTEWVVEPYQLVNVNFNKFAAGVTYYF